jgi:hypothetical protein
MQNWELRKSIRAVDRCDHPNAIILAIPRSRRIARSVLFAPSPRRSLCPSFFFLVHRFGPHRAIRAARIRGRCAGSADRCGIGGFARSLRRRKIFAEKHDRNTDDESYADNQPEFSVIGHDQGPPFVI